MRTDSKLSSLKPVTVPPLDVLAAPVCVQVKVCAG